MFIIFLYFCTYTMEKRDSTYFHSFEDPSFFGTPLPEKINFPFLYTPHPLSILAAQQVQAYLKKAEHRDHDFGIENKTSPQALGKMFGVLVARSPTDDLGFFAAYSGKLGSRNDYPYFVPAVFDLLNPKGFFKIEEAQISKLNDQIKSLENRKAYLKAKEDYLLSQKNADSDIRSFKRKMKEEKKKRDKLRKENKEILSADAYQFLLDRLANESKDIQYSFKKLKKEQAHRVKAAKEVFEKLHTEIALLKEERKNRSAALQDDIFKKYTFLNAHQEEKSLYTIFQKELGITPPAGAGECAAPKLFQHAFETGYAPLCFAEFWWGKAPSSEVRKHTYFYPACKLKCEPILNYMLEKSAVDKNPLVESPHILHKSFDIVYEDEAIIVVNKAENLLSVPGKLTQDSLLTRVQKRYEDCCTPLLVHRLDRATSGILLFAKHPEYHRFLQKEFLHRRVQKEYTAVLDGTFSQSSGAIDLPLRVDLENRPHQLVCEQFGKRALTHYRVLERKEGRTRIRFLPVTGRTHQLRVHAAHHMGLDSPIVGDDLYGKPDTRLHLHAERLSFAHPISKKKVSFHVPCAF